MPIPTAFLSALPLSLRAPSSASPSALSSISPRRPAPSRLPRAPRRAVMKLGDGPDNAPPGKIISTALDIGFRAVWVQLLTAGVGPEYEAAITDFVVACIAARKAGYSTVSLRFELSRNEPFSEDPEIMKLALNDKEKSTRMVWVSLVWLTLRRYGFPTGREVDDDDITSGLGTDDSQELAEGLVKLVRSVCEAADAGYDLSTYKLEQSIGRKEGEEPPTASMLSIMSQWARIVFATINILPNELKSQRKNNL